MKNKKTKKWILPRHTAVRNIVNAVYGPVIRKKYGVSVEPFREQGKRQYLILYNHQTAYDQFFVGMAFSGAVYYVASEDIFSMGAVSRLIKFLVNPIPIKKQTTDARAVINCIKVAKEGGTIAIAPEGNRTYSGRPAHINPSIASLAKHLKLPVAIFRIEGGYGVHPRWSDVIRRGEMKAYVSRVIEPEELTSLTNEALYELISRELNVDEARSDKIYESEALAEYLERAMYVCPDCGLSSFESRGDIIECKRCSKKIKYLPSTELVGIGKPFPFRFVADWYDYQCDYVNRLDTLKMREKALYTDEATLYEVFLYKSKKMLSKRVKIDLYGDRLVIVNGKEEQTVPFDSLSVLTVLGKNKLNIYTAETVYQIKGGARFNALKYVNLFYRYKNLKKGDGYDKFLGL